MSASGVDFSLDVLHFREIFQPKGKVFQYCRKRFQRIGKLFHSKGKSFVWSLLFFASVDNKKQTL